jgi:hypothetical protein
MQIDPEGGRHWFPILDPLPGETYADRLARSEQAYRDEKDRARVDEAINGDYLAKERSLKAHDRYLARSYGQRARTPLGHSGNCGHRRHSVTRPATAGKW